jgi:hypothetical protein
MTYLLPTKFKRPNCYLKYLIALSAINVKVKGFWNAFGQMKSNMTIFMCKLLFWFLKMYYDVTFVSECTEITIRATCVSFISRFGLQIYV